MAQRNTVIGNITNVRINENNEWVLCDTVTGMTGGTKIFLSIADRYWSTKLQSLETRFIPFQAFIPEGMTIRKGQLVAADFIVNPYVDKDGYATIAFDIINFDFSLSMGNSGVHIDPEKGMRVAGGQFNDVNDSTESSANGSMNDSVNSSMNNNVNGSMGNNVNSSVNNNMNNNVQNGNADDGFRNIPDGIDEELPFN